MHETVLKNESVEILKINSDGLYLDLTGGGGGHSQEMLSRLSTNGRLMIFDQDLEAVERLENKFKDSKNVIVIHDNYSNIRKHIAKEDFEKIDGILMDLGVSSFQLSSLRGFSFQTDSPLDMRMNQKSDLTAYQVVNHYSEHELHRIIKEYGEEKFSKKIAKKIIQERKLKPIHTTEELTALISKIVPKTSKKNPATKTFQAIRMEVNQELQHLSKALDECFQLLRNGGRLAVISFHSLEDRIVKTFFKEKSQGCVCPKSLPICVCHQKPLAKLVLSKPIKPSNEEVSRNVRSRSSKLRCIEKI